MKIELNVQNYIDRERVVVSLANSGYTVRVLERPHPQSLLSKKYFVEVEIENQ